LNRVEPFKDVLVGAGLEAQGVLLDRLPVLIAQVLNQAVVLFPDKFWMRKDENAKSSFYDV
jgi:hypothetical protein